MIPLRVVFLVLCTIVYCSATVERIGLFIGNNQGLFNEPDLKYATRDAQQMAKVFESSKNFDADRVFLLENPSVDNIKILLSQIQGRIAELHKSNRQSMLLFYYSGHGSAEALHVDGKKFDREDLLAYINDVESDIKIIIVDACESGKLLRKKGGTLIQNEQVVQVDTLKNKGTVIITSSGADEFSLESEEYKGAVFTHHLLNGLHGLADYNSDREIGLWEAFYYARLSTQSDNVVRKAKQQSPGFDFDLVGETDVVLTELQKGDAEVTFNHFPSIPVSIYNSQTMELFSKLQLTGKNSVRYMLPAGSYIASFEGDGYIKAMRMDLTWVKSKELSPKDFKRQPKSLIYTKGGHRFVLNPYGVQVSVGGNDLTNQYKNQFGPLPSLWNYTLSFIVRNSNLKNVFSFGYAADDLDGKYLASKRVFGSVSYSALVPVVPVTYGQLLIGPHLKYTHVWEEITDKRFLEVNPEDINPVTYSEGNIYSVGLPIEVEFYLPFGSWMSLGYTLSMSYFKDAEDSYTMQLQGGPEISLGIQF